MCIEILHGPPDTDILVKYVFELRRTCPNYQWKKAYCHFNAIKVWANAIHVWASAIKVWADLQFVNESEAQERNEIFENGPTNLNLQNSPTSPATVPEDAPVQSPQFADPARGIHNSSNYTLDPDTVARNIANIRQTVEQNIPRRQSSRPAPYAFATNVRNGHIAWRRSLRGRANMPGSGVFDTTARHRVHCQECGRGYVRVSISTTITTTSTWINPYPQEWKW